MGRNCWQLISGQWVVLLSLSIAILAGGCSGGAVIRSANTFPQGTGFMKRDITVDGKTSSLWVFIPKDYRPGKQYPAIVFLHGLFEAGNGSDACLSSGLGPVIAENPDVWPFITIFPQSTGTWRGEARERQVLESLDFAQSQWQIDPDRVVLAGLSFGGLGTWEIGAHHPERFAALVPVSGPHAAEAIQRLVLLPAWAFSFAGDMFVNPHNSEEMCREIASKGGHVRLTEFSGVGHDCWPEAIHESDLVQWMLDQRRNPAFSDTNSTHATVLAQSE